MPERDRVIEKLDLVIAERAALVARGPHFRVVCRQAAADRLCPRVLEPMAAFLVFRGRDYDLQLSPALLSLFTCLAWHRHLSQSAGQIAEGTRQELSLSNSGIVSLATIPRRAVKVYIQRLRGRLARAFASSELHLNPYHVITSVTTDSSVALYRLRAAIEVHVLSKGYHPPEPRKRITYL